MKSQETFDVQIPFAGFYEAHDRHMLEYEFEQTFADPDTGCEVNLVPMFGDEVARLFWDRVHSCIHWAGVYEAYAAEYVDAFLTEFDLDGEFADMSSPRYYNFETDRLFARITRDSLAKIAREVLRSPSGLRLFETNCALRHKSRDGFISHYDYRWKTWGRVSEWDHNQLATLLLSYAEIEKGGDWEFYDEVELMEDARGNGKFWGWFHEHQREGEFDKLRDLFEWMVKRINRGSFTMADYVAARRAENRPFSDTPLGGHFHA